MQSSEYWKQFASFKNMEGLFDKIINSPISIHVSLLIINIKIFYNPKKDWCTFDTEKICLKNKLCIWANFDSYKHAKRLLKHHQFESIFDHWKFSINGACCQKKLTIQIIVFPFLFFKFLEL
jgi:hypothetical protein